MGESQILYTYITSLINIAFIHNEHENQYMLESSIKAYKYKHNMKDRDSCQTDELVSMSPKHGSPPIKTSLKVMHPKM